MLPVRTEDVIGSPPKSTPNLLRNPHRRSPLRTRIARRRRTQIQTPQRHRRHQRPIHLFRCSKSPPLVREPRKDRCEVSRQVTTGAASAADNTSSSGRSVVQLGPWSEGRLPNVKNPPTALRKRGRTRGRHNSRLETWIRHPLLPMKRLLLTVASTAALLLPPAPSAADARFTPCPRPASSPSCATPTLPEPVSPQGLRSTTAPDAEIDPSPAGKSAMEVPPGAGRRFLSRSPGTSSISVTADNPADAQVDAALPPRGVEGRVPRRAPATGPL